MLKSYEDSCYPEKIKGAGRAVYVQRNYEMINKSKYCIVYYDGTHAPAIRKSGTGIALEYARKQGREVKILPDIC